MLFSDVETSLWRLFHFNSNFIFMVQECIQYMLELWMASAELRGRLEESVCIYHILIDQHGKSLTETSYA
jgi:hypothetical protein